MPEDDQGAVGVEPFVIGDGQEALRMRERYVHISGADWFVHAYDGKSLGETPDGVEVVTTGGWRYVFAAGSGWPHDPDTLCDV